MRILGIDPGTRHTGYAVLELPQKLELSGTLTPDKKLRGLERQLWLLSRLGGLLIEFAVDMLVYEEFTWRTQERAVVGRSELERLIGGIQGLALCEPYPVIMSLEPSTWGHQLSGSLQHSKEQIAMAVNLRLGSSFKGNSADNHACDAVGLALVAADNWLRNDLVKYALKRMKG